MPGYDGSGPRGFGPMTGWGRGPCGSGAGRFNRAGGLGFGGGRGGWGRGFRRGGGAGPGWGRGYGQGYANAAWGYGPAAGPAYGDPYGGVSPEREAGFLKDEAEALRQELDAVQRRIAELESKDDSSS